MHGEGAGDVMSPWMFNADTDGAGREAVLGIWRQEINCNLQDGMIPGTPLYSDDSRAIVHTQAASCGILGFSVV